MGVEDDHPLVRGRSAAPMSGCCAEAGMASSEGESGGQEDAHAMVMSFIARGRAQLVEVAAQRLGRLVDRLLEQRA